MSSGNDEHARPLRCFVAVGVGDEILEAVTRVMPDLENAVREDGLRVSWTRPEGRHVTLKFLGDLAAERVAEVSQALERALGRCEAAELGACGLMMMPSLRDPRVVAVRIVDRGGLAELASRTDAAMVALGFAAESRRFRPHLTLGRVRLPGRTGPLRPALSSAPAATPGRPGAHPRVQPGVHPRAQPYGGSQECRPRDRAAARAEVGGKRSGPAATRLHEAVEGMRDHGFGIATIGAVDLFSSELGPGGSRYTRLARVELAHKPPLPGKQ